MTDREAFYREHVGYVVTVLTRGFRFESARGGSGFHRVEDPFEVEDLTQEAFAAFFRQLEHGNYDPSRPAVPYLRRIALNLALKRAGRRAREVSLEDAPEPPSVAPAPTVEQSELKALMAEFRTALSPREAEILDRYAEDDRASQAEVGASLGLSRDQVYRSLCSIRARAAAFFAERGWLP